MKRAADSEPGSFKKLFRSLPAQKLSPLPVIVMTRMSLSSLPRSIASRSASYIAGVNAFFFSGRLSWIRRMWLESVVVMLIIGMVPDNAARLMNVNHSEFYITIWRLHSDFVAFLLAQ